MQTNKPVLNLTPGIYIMAGGGFTPSNGEIDSAAGDIMIYSTDVAAYYGKNCMTTAPAPAANYCQGDIFINGQANINLSGLNLDPCPPISSTGCPYVGILFWQDALASKAASGGTPIITINGGTNLRLSGTIYNSAGDTTLNGGSSTTGCTGLEPELRRGPADQQDDQDQRRRRAEHALRPEQAVPPGQPGARPLGPRD